MVIYIEAMVPAAPPSTAQFTTRYKNPYLLTKIGPNTKQKYIHHKYNTKEYIYGRVGE